MRLRSKLLLAQLPFAAALLVLGVISARSVAQLGRNAELILKDNYRSILAAERMRGAAGELDRVALSETFGRGGPARDGASQSLERFEAALRVQESNITERGEAEMTRDLRDRWTAYQAALDRLRSTPPAARAAVYFGEALPALDALQRRVQDVLETNQEATVTKSERAQRQAERTNVLVVVVTLGVLLVGVFTASTLTARLVRPLSVLSQSVRRLGEGDLEARARVEGNDEIARLAHEFNGMADKLGQYRRSSLGELLQAQQASQAAIDSLSDPVVVLDAGGGIMNVNRAAEDLLRIPGGPEDPLRLLEPAVREVLQKVRAHVVGGKGAYVPRGFEEAVRTQSSEGDRYLLPRATPLYSEQGAIVGASIVLQDVTRLMRFDELKNDLVATVAHEFRTPLTSLRMAIHLLAEEVVGSLSEKQKDLVFAARQDCERLQGIVDDLLDLSRIQAGRVDLRRGPISAGALLAEAAAGARSGAEAGQLELSISAPDPDVMVDGDPERLQLVLSNLIANAVRYTPPGGRIGLTGLAGPDAVRFEVADTGVGVPREYQERIFEKYFQVPGGKGGVGLGLYIAREIVLAHGGDMGVESEPGRGSRFWFTVPLAKRASAAA